MAARAKVSRSMISKIERNEVQPSLSVAVRLAIALGTTLPEMLRYDEYARVIKLTKGEQAVIRNSDQGWERRILSPSFHEAAVEVSRVVLNSKVKLGSFPPHPKGSEEHILVLGGKLRIRLDGATVVLEKGDSLFFEADRKHVFENASQGKTEFFVVIKK